MTDKQAALPYASAYKQDEQEIKRLLVEAGMETSGNFNEPADHLAIYLELLSHLHFSLGEGTVPARRIDNLRQKHRRRCDNGYQSLLRVAISTTVSVLRGTKPVIAGVSGMRPPKQITSFVGLIRRV